MYGKIVNGKFVEGRPNASKTLEQQKFEMFIKGFLPVVEVEKPGDGYEVNYVLSNENIFQSWVYSKELHIADLKQALSDTDYAVIKIAEGAATKEEYADIIAQRQIWRAQINELLASD